MSTIVEPKAPVRVVVVIPNWNGGDDLLRAVESVLGGSLKPHLIIVDNGSVDNSIELVSKRFENNGEIEIIRHTYNKGYAGGVNPGFKRALELGADYAAPFNNDAVADRLWLEKLVEYLDSHVEAGIACCKVASIDGTHLDSTGDQYTTWGLPYPRGREEPDTGQYDSLTDIFAASGAASLYRVQMLRGVGLLDEDFFAYYEDVDLSFRAQLAGWKVAYVPKSVVRHATSTTGSKIKGFFTLQTQKNLPMLLLKNVPGKLFWTILPRFTLVYLSFFVSAAGRGQLWYALKGFGIFLVRLPRKLGERGRIQRGRKVSVDYIASMLTWDLPPNAAKLRRLRARWWTLTRKSTERREDKPMSKILIDAREYSTSTGRYVRRLLEYLDEIDYENRTGNEFIVLMKPADLDNPPFNSPAFSRIACPHKEFTLDEQWGLLGQITSYKPDLVHFCMTQQPVAYRGPVVTTMHDLTTMRFRNPARNPLAFGMKQQVYKWIVKKAARKSNLIIAPTEFVKKDIVEYTDVPSDKVIVTYEAADPISDPAKAVKGLEGKRYIMYVGRPQPHKNLGRLIDAFALLKARYPGLHLVLAGKTDPLYERHRALAARRGIQDVFFTDYVTEGQLRWLYEHCAAYIFPSLSEGFGLPGLEAMIHGAPVVSSNATCLPEVYGNAAHYFDPTDTEDIAKRIGEVLDDPKLREKLIKLGKVQAGKYSWRRMAEQTMEVYRTALKQ